MVMMWLWLLWLLCRRPRRGIMRSCSLTPCSSRITPRVTRAGHGPEEVGRLPVPGVFLVVIVVIAIRYPVIFYRHIAIRNLIVITVIARLASRCPCATALTSGPGWELTTRGVTISSWDQHHCHRGLVEYHRFLLWVLSRPTSFSRRGRRV